MSCPYPDVICNRVLYEVHGSYTILVASFSGCAHDVGTDHQSSQSRRLEYFRHIKCLAGAGNHARLSTYQDRDGRNSETRLYVLP